MNNIMIRNGIYAKQPSKYTNKNYKQHLTSIICSCTAPSNTTNYVRNVDTKFPHPSEKEPTPGSCLVTGFIKQIGETNKALLAFIDRKVRKLTITNVFRICAEKSLNRAKMFGSCLIM